MPGVYARYVSRKQRTEKRQQVGPLPLNRVFRENPRPNLAPTSKRLVVERLAADRKALETSQPEFAGRPLPAGMLTTFASGLDPDISPADAVLQVARVAQARGVPMAQIMNLLQHHISGRSLGIFGEPRVNVLALNLALQSTYPRPTPNSRTAANLW